MVKRLERARDELEQTWETRGNKLTQVLDQQMFFREANQLEALSTTQEVNLVFMDNFVW